jgi:hypothetical protein
MQKANLPMERLIFLPAIATIGGQQASQAPDIPRTIFQDRFGWWVGL